VVQATTSFAQVVDPDYKKTVDFLQGDGVVDTGTLEFINELRQSIIPIFDIFIDDAKALCAVFMIIFFAIKSYEMMTGDKKMEIMPLLRPFGLFMVIIWWGTFVQMIAFPTEIIAEKARDKAAAEQAKVNDLRYTRAEYQMKLANELFSIGAEATVAKQDAEETNKGLSFGIGDALDSFKDHILDPVIEWSMRLEIQMKLLMTQTTELIAMWILRIAITVVFLIQIIYASILTILGPFSVAASVLPAFRDSFTTWVARYVSVNLYLGIAYIIILLTTVYQNFAMQSEINRYIELIGKDGMDVKVEAIKIFAQNGLLSFGTVIVAFLVGAICMFTVPSISTWIISTSGITSAASTAGRAGGAVVAGARKVITKV